MTQLQVPLTEGMLDLKTYVKLFHHLAIHHRCIPIGIYRSSKVPVRPVSEYRLHCLVVTVKLRLHLCVVKG